MKFGSPFGAVSHGVRDRTQEKKRGIAGGQAYRKENALEALVEPLGCRVTSTLPIRIMLRALIGSH